MTRTMPARLPKLQRKVIHKVPGDIDVDAIVIPKCSDQSYSQVCSKTKKVGRCHKNDMTRTMPARLPKLQQRKVTDKVPGAIDIDAIMIPKCNGQSHSQCAARPERWEDVNRLMCANVHNSQNNSCQTSKVATEESHEVPDNIDSGQCAARCSLSLS